MSTQKPKPKPKLMRVNCNLFAADVEAIKREAALRGDLGWQPRLRKIVHDAVRTKGVLS